MLLIETKTSFAQKPFYWMIPGKKKNQKEENKFLNNEST